MKSVRKRLNVLWLTTKISNAAEIAELAGVSLRSVYDFINLYKTSGIDGLMETNYRKPQSELMDYADIIKAELEANPPRTVKEASGKIKSLTGIKRSLTQIREFLYKIGMKIIKPTKVPMGKNETSIEEKIKKQKDFVEEKLEPLIQKAKNGEITLLFMDACHMMLACVVSFIWCFVPKYIPALSVKGRVNVIGAVSMYGDDLICDVTQDSVNQHTIAYFLAKIRNKFKKGKITLVLDNATCHKTKHALNAAEKLGIDLVFLPVASPNLNIIERLWKMIKTRFLYNKVFENLDELEKHLNNAIKTLRKKHKKQMGTLLTPNF